MREFELIEWIKSRRQQAPRSLLVGIGDDGAVFDASRWRRLVVTADALVEGVHFQREWSPPRLLGRKALAVSISDLAAMGAEPHACLLGLSVPCGAEDEWLKWVLEGFLESCREWDCPLVGGNVSGAPGLHLAVTAWGTIGEGEAVTRSGARPGQTLAIAGRIGLARRGLRRLRSPQDRASPSEDTSEVEAFLNPQPWPEYGAWLRRESLASAMIDISDGLCADLGHLLRASGVSAELEEPNLPKDAPLEDALRGGEDYALLFAIPRERAGELRRCPLPDPPPCGIIGTLGEGPARAWLKDASGRRRELSLSGYDHLSGRGEEHA